MGTLKWLALGVLSLLVTACDEPEHDADLFNARDVPLRYQVRVLRSEFCRFSQDAGVHPAEAFEEPSVRTLAAQDYVALPRGSCNVVWLTIDGVFDGVISWSYLGDGEDPDHVDHELIDRSVTVEGTAEKSRATIGKGLHAFGPPQ